MCVMFVVEIVRSIEEKLGKGFYPLLLPRERNGSPVGGADSPSRIAFPSCFLANAKEISRKFAEIHNCTNKHTDQQKQAR